ncbi:MAG: DUF167 domain-containing protein [Patescibacteria group bacterium]
MWYYEKDGGTVLQVKVITGARQPSLSARVSQRQAGAVGIVGDFIKIKITARPEKGKANKVLVNFLAKRFDVPPTAVRIVRGHTQSLKLVFIPVVTDVIKRLFLK